MEGEEGERERKIARRELRQMKGSRNGEEKERNGVEEMEDRGKRRERKVEIREREERNPVWGIGMLLFTLPCSFQTFLEVAFKHQRRSLNTVDFYIVYASNLKITCMMFDCIFL